MFHFTDLTSATFLLSTACVKDIETIFAHVHIEKWLQNVTPLKMMPERSDTFSGLTFCYTDLLL